MSRLLVFGITSASGGIEQLMHSFILFEANNKRFDKISVVTSYNTIFYEEDYKKMGVQIIRIPSRKDKLSYKKTINQLISTLSSNDLVYVNLSTYCNWALLATIKKSKGKILIHGHNSYVKNPIKKVIHWLGKILYRGVGFKVAVSEECARFMFGNNKHAVIYNGIDSELFKFDLDKRNLIRRELSIKEGKLLVGCVGRISDEKNQSYLVDIAKKYSNIDFVFLGDFMSIQYKKRIMKKSKPNCLFVGSRSNVGEYLSAMDAFVLPSKHEAFPLAAVEALTNGMLVFCHPALEKCLPSIIGKNPSCLAIHNKQLDLYKITEQHNLRSKDNVLFSTNYDIKIFLKKMLTYIDLEVMNND